MNVKRDERNGILNHVEGKTEQGIARPDVNEESKMDISAQILPAKKKIKL